MWRRLTTLPITTVSLDLFVSRQRPFSWRMAGAGAGVLLCRVALDPQRPAGLPRSPVPRDPGRRE